jgi:hypothetical protein
MPETFFQFPGHILTVNEVFTYGNLFMTPEDELADAKYIDQACLGMGLVLRDIHDIHFQEPDMESGLPEFMVNCDITLDHQTPILEACKWIASLIENLSHPVEPFVYFIHFTFSII